MVVQSNISAMNANRQLNIVSGTIGKNMEKLSSGYRINRAADDAAGLAISEKMRRQIRGLTQASSNAQDGVSFCQIADGALDEVHAMVKRCKELAVKAANGTNQDEDRSYIQDEINEISSEIDRIHNTAEFNEIKVFSDNGLDPGDLLQNSVGLNNITVEWNFVDASGNRVTPSESKAVGSTNSNNISDLGNFVVDAAKNAVTKLQSLYPTLFSNASSPNIKIGLNVANIDGVGNTLASAALSISASSSSAVTSYSLNIDTSDYSVAGFATMPDAKKADLAATVAHEMTHLVMYDTLTDNMLSGRTTSFPQWFIEGMAQTSSGDNGWLSNHISDASSDADIKSYMSRLQTMPYGAGYLATMVLGFAASRETTVNSTNIAKGLDALLAPVSNRSKTLDQIIDEKTSYSSLADFENKFRSGEASTLAIVRDILTARGSGAGSLMGELNDAESSVFNPNTLLTSATNYAIDQSSTWMANAFGAGYTFPSLATKVGNGYGLNLQVGAEADNKIYLRQFNISVKSLFGGAGMDVSTQELADNTLSVIDKADAKVSTVRAYYGAMQNRLEHTINNLNNVVENTQSAESSIRDTDMAKEMVAFSNNNILQQAGQAMLAQANQINQGVLSLLG